MEVAYGRYAILTETGTSAEAPENVLQSLSYPDTLPQQPSGESLGFMRSTFEKKMEVPAEENRAVWNFIIDAGDVQRDRKA